jgi:4-hydroxybenzoate polyprenyltransferase
MTSGGLDSWAVPATSRPPWSVASGLLLSLRPHQWTKNLVVFAGLLFGRKLGDVSAALAAVSAFAIFCGLSGAAYLFNDVADRESDRRHPLKRRRPIAAGLVAVPTAIGAAVVLSIVSLGGAAMLGRPFASAALAYGLLAALYSTVLKHLVILDVLGIAIGFVLRAVAGALAVQVAISQWLFVCTILLALFISLAKRRHEIVLLADDASSHRPILGEYSAYLLDQLIAIAAGSSLIAYMLYAISPETAGKFGTARLDLTIPFPMYGIFRYLYLIHRQGGGGNPTDLLLGDFPMLACVVLWALSVVFIIYVQP